ncbi:MAG: carbohydrate ABC transporter permease [Clostridia bacterium]|nr:carbohydrate ABC transporter permease [Clostridia bacterium]MBR5985530.1 carbohydrate ABC transporter permease [Clostridia bacterium]MBR6009267.1 carbohydrate ABC transporter permease [Clostridia bacterium]
MNRNQTVTGRNAIKLGTADKVTMGVIYFLLGVAVFITLYPLIFVFSASVSDPYAVYGGKVWLFPKGLQWRGYTEVFSSHWVFVGYRNSLIYLVLGTALNLFVTFTGSYALSRKDIYLRGLLTGIIVFTMWFNGGMIPTFLLVKGLGLVDSFWAMIVIGAVNAYNFIICRSFIQNSIPEELQEAGRIDGCNDFALCARIVLPLSGPIIAVLTLYYGLEHWNGYFNAMLYLNRRELQPLQIFLREILLQDQTIDLSMDLESLQEIELIKRVMKYSLIIIASLPMLILYPFLQRFFSKGVMIGAIKG